MKYTFEEHLKPIVDGGVELPNFEPQEPMRVLSTIAASGGSMQSIHGWAKIKGHKKWAHYFLMGAGMGSPPHTYGGSGYVIAYPDFVGTFAICRHTKVDGAGANHNRGWHPGSCSKCGMDMTVDSGD